MNGGDADLGWLAPGPIAPPARCFHFSTSFYGNGRTKFPKKAERRLSLSSSRSARRGNTKIGQSLSPREQAAQIQKLSVRLESNNPAANRTLELRNSARIGQSLDSTLVLLTRWLSQVSVVITLTYEMVKSAATPVRAANPENFSCVSPHLPFYSRSVAGWQPDAQKASAGKRQRLCFPSKEHSSSEALSKIIFSRSRSKAGFMMGI